MDRSLHPESFMEVYYYPRIATIPFNTKKWFYTDGSTPPSIYSDHCDEVFESFPNFAPCTFYSRDGRRHYYPNSIPASWTEPYSNYQKLTNRDRNTF